MARLAELKAELLCTDNVESQWLSDVKEWAAGGKHDKLKETANILFHCYLIFLNIKDNRLIIYGL